MRVDEAGERAGSEIRERFADEYAPALPWELVASPERRTYMSRFVIVVAGLMVVAVATTLTLVALDARTPTRSSHGSQVWQRVSFAKAIGRNSEISSVVSGANVWVAVGSIQHPERRCIRWGCDTPAVWRSTDGAVWARSRGPRVGRIVALGAHGGNFSIIERSRRGDRVWTSGDGRSWTPRERFPIESAEWNLFSTDSGFVAASFQAKGPPNTTVWRSADGKRWSRVRKGVGTNVGLVPQAQLAARFLAVGSEKASTGLFGSSQVSVMTSHNAVDWSPQRSNLVPEFVRSNAARTRLLGVSYDPPGTPGAGHLFASRDGSVWREVPGFRDRFPFGNPHEMIASGRWWIIAGSQGYDPRSTRIWASPDSRHWISLPHDLRVPAANTSEFVMAARGRAVVVASPVEHTLWVWHQPRSVPRLVSVVVQPDRERPPCCKQPPETIGTALFERSDAAAVAVDVLETQRFTVDLEPGTYRMTGVCGAQTVKVRARDTRVDVRCRMK